VSSCEGPSKIESIVRKLEARTREALLELIGTVLSAVKLEDAAGWFDHAGYDQIEKTIPCRGPLKPGAAMIPQNRRNHARMRCLDILFETGKLLQPYCNRAGKS
jgi:hypothetical protein